MARPVLRQTIFGTDVPIEGVIVQMDDRGGVTEFNPVAPGRYEMTQGDPPRVVELDANASQQIDPGAGTPAAAVSGTLQTTSGAPPAAVALVTLEPADSAQGLRPMETTAIRGQFSFAAVPAGAWKLRVESSGGQSAVVSIAANGRAHAGNMVAVQDRALVLAVTASAGGMRVEGFAKKDGKGVAGAMVLLIPKGEGGFPDLVRRDQSDSDGSFSLRDAAPGQYTVVAIEDGWGLDWTSPQTIGRYLAGGVTVAVKDAGEKVVRLAEAVPVQQR